MIAIDSLVTFLATHTYLQNLRVLGFIFLLLGCLFIAVFWVIYATYKFHLSRWKRGNKMETESKRGMTVLLKFRGSIYFSYNAVTSPTLALIMLSDSDNKNNCTSALFDLGQAIQMKENLEKIIVLLENAEDEKI